jgi:DNA-binding MarR family transcriptional regulator
VSYQATSWAIRQRGLKPATKIVLWHLCDFYHPERGCAPSQGTLAASCELSRSTVNLHLDELERCGLIRRFRRNDSDTHKQRTTFYVLGFQPDFFQTSGGKV